MATNPPDVPQPTQTAQPDVPPPEINPPGPDIDVPAPGTDMPGQASPSI